MDRTPAAPSEFGVLQQHSEELGRVAVLGGCEQDGSEEPKLDLIKLLRLREQVKHQNFELQNMVQASDVPSDLYPEEGLDKIAKELQKEIENVKVSYRNKTMVLQRMQQVQALLIKLQEQTHESRLINDTIKHAVELSSLTLKAQAETRDLEEKIYEVKKKRLSLKEKGSSIMLEIQTFKKKQKCDLEEIENTNVKKICKVLEQEMNITTVTQNVYQHLILGSRVNWAEDPKLKDMVLNLEKDINTL
ncbi:centromere protein H [Pelodytes ibericus]